ncbi:MAG: two pore domain potassium channel family protein [Clostridiaceae bacterium]|nr:two pore domain potassium channel family protein [Clostridiaceae bacterium]
MDILKRVSVLLITYVMVVSLNIIAFAYLYNTYGSIIYSNGAIENSSASSGLVFSDAIYFSGITYLTIGYGDITAVHQLGKFLTVLQGFSGVIINSTFTGMFLYYLVKRPKNILITNRVFIRYKEDTDKFYFSVRVGNKGRALVNVNRVLEIFVYENGVRKRRFHMSQEYYYFEKLLYWDIDLQDKTNKELLDYLKVALFKEDNISIRISIIGTDVEVDELVFVSRYYAKHNIEFIKDYVGLYQWYGDSRSNINWHCFNKVCKLEEEKIKMFEKL